MSFWFIQSKAIIRNIDDIFLLYLRILNMQIVSFPEVILAKIQ